MKLKQVQGAVAVAAATAGSTDLMVVRICWMAFDGKPV